MCEADGAFVLLPRLKLKAEQQLLRLQQRPPPPLFVNLRANRTMEGSAVFHCSVPDLFLRLSRSILAQAMLTPAQIYDWSYLKPTKQLIYAQDPKKTRWLFKQLTSQCLDMVLLKQYEWQPLSSTTGCPVSRCLGLSLTLRLAGLTKEADMLTAAIESLATGNSNLTEVDNILQFLFLLSNKDTEQILSW